MAIATTGLIGRPASGAGETRTVPSVARTKAGRIHDPLWSDPAPQVPARGRPEPLRHALWIAIVVIVGASIGVGVHLHRSHPGGDPHGKILAALDALASRSVPPGAKVVLRTHSEPVWDSCDGMSGTFGWDPARVVIELQPGPAATMVLVSRHLADTGWTQAATLDYTHTRWTKALSTGQVAQADVVSGSDLPVGSDPSQIDLDFAVQPPGPAVRGC